MTDEPAVISPEAVALAATRGARIRRVVSAVPLTVATVFGLALAVSACAHPHEAGAIGIAFVVTVLLPGLAAGHFLRTARRLRQIARTARNDAGVRWFLASGVIVASRNDVPCPELTFAIERSTEKQLTAMPGARLLR